MDTKTLAADQSALPRASRALAGIEAWRGVAACMVVAVHATTMTRHGAPAAFGGFWQFGRAGVDFFFVLSGFIISLVHLDDLGRPDQFAAFWIKRLLRIFPIYWIVSAAFGVLLWISPTAGREEQQLGHILASALLLPEHIDPILDVGWSLRHELLFYALFGIALLNRRLGLMVLAAWLIGILIGLAVQLVTGQPWFTTTLPGFVFRGFNVEFFFGIMVAVLLRGGFEWRPKLALSLGCAGFLLTGMFESFGPSIMREWPIRHIAYASSAALIIWGTARLDIAGASKVPGALLRLGAASYSIYLVHTPLILVLDYALQPWRAGIAAELTWLIMMAASIVSGVVFSEIVEQPLLRVGRRIFLKPRTAKP